MELRDVVVIGAGPAGSATALELARRQISTMLIDRAEERPRVGETLAPGIQTRLRSLGVWQQFCAANHARSFGLRVRWGSHAPFENDSILNPYGNGWHIDRAAFDAMLREAAQSAGAKLLAPAKVETLTSNPDGTWRMAVNSPGGATQEFRARFVVDASGRSSSLARRFGGHRLLCDRMVGLAATYAPAARERFRRQTLIEAAENGWWYSALQPDGRVIVVYMTDADLGARDVHRDARRWSRELAKTAEIGARVAAHRMISAPAVIPAFSCCRSRISGNGWLAVGDAAMAFDPLSGQGIDHALQSAQRAARAIEGNLCGDADAPPKYEQSIVQAFDNYLRIRRNYYRREQRWCDREFWRRRHGERTPPEV